MTPPLDDGVVGESSMGGRVGTGGIPELPLPFELLKRFWKEGLERRGGLEMVAYSRMFPLEAREWRREGGW